MAGAEETSTQAPPGLAGLAEAARGAGRALPPVHLWNPPGCGDIGLAIRRDGSWTHEGAPIARHALARLFSTILRHDADGHVLVTPVEKVRVVVEDAPFVVVEMAVERGPEGQVLRLRTNMDDWTSPGADAPLRFERDAQGGLKPYALVRGDLWALFTRALVADLVDLAETRAIEGRAQFGVASRGAFFPICPADEIEALG